jgi:nucleoid DNA-binding protein
MARRKVVKGVKKAMTKSQMFSEIAAETELTKKEVASVFDSLETILERHIKKGSVGYCTVPGLMKVKTVKKPARKAKKNVPNPFRPGELMDIQAKPASTRVKILPLKRLKDMV